LPKQGGAAELALLLLPPQPAAARLATTARDIPAAAYPALLMAASWSASRPGPDRRALAFKNRYQNDKRVVSWESIESGRRPEMDSFTGKLAVVTGGGSGMGRELVRQLAAQGCSVAACDIHAESVAETAALARAAADERALVTSHACDVADEAQVLRFRDDLVAAHDTDHVDLVFSNAGIGGAGSFVCDKRADWERTFAIDFWGMYYCARAFLPLLIASGDGILVNTSSVNGFWATLGPGMPNTAYSTAKFAVKGFTEALIEDLRTNAPQVTVAVVMPGHVGTDIIKNTRRILGYAGPEQMSEAELEEARPALARLGLTVEDASLDELRDVVVNLENQFKDSAPLSAAAAATIILDGVRAGNWRILVGDDAIGVDRAVRARPEDAYDYAALAAAAGEARATGAPAPPAPPAP
jgi:NAD(P)-dependent dehydrogenase (short-subunit alcohol dehydrogenase family)